jgi:hypothetical protein
MEVCEELAFHGIEYILSVSVADGQVLHVDVEKVKAPCTSRNARCSALHDAGAPATPVRAFTSGCDVQKEHAHDAQKEDVHATMRRRRTRTPSFGAMRRRRTRTPSSSTECTTSSRSYTLTSHLCDFRDGGGRGMARGGKVNSTCCSANKNAELVPDSAGVRVRMYVRTTRKVRVDNEILVMYQPDRGFFGGVQGRCRCLCEKRIPECCV